MSKPRKIRIELRKNRTPRTRPSDWTRRFATDDFEAHDPEQGERIELGAYTLTCMEVTRTAISQVKITTKDVKGER